MLNDVSLNKADTFNNDVDCILKSHFQVNQSFLDAWLNLATEVTGNVDSFHVGVTCFARAHYRQEIEFKTRH